MAKISDPTHDAANLASLHGVKMRAIESTEGAAISAETLFEFEQVGSRFSARYRGGAIADGFLLGSLLGGGALIFRYVQADHDGNLDAGVSTGSVSRLADGRLRLVENFQWLTRAEEGQNVLEESNE